MHNLTWYSASSFENSQLKLLLGWIAQYTPAINSIENSSFHIFQKNKFPNIVPPSLLFLETENPLVDPRELIRIYLKDKLILHTFISLL